MLFFGKEINFFNEIEMKMKLFNQKRLEMKVENENYFLFPFLFSIYIIPL